MIPQLIALRERVNALESTASIHAESMSQLGQISALRGETLDGILARLERLESARIAAPVALMSAETASGVPQEPGNATEARSTPDDLPPLDDMEAMLYLPPRLKPEVASALRMYRKVQGCRTLDDGVSVEINASEHWYETAAGLLAWLKEGEA